MDETKREKGLIVEFGQIFINRFNKFPVTDQEKIFDFTTHIKLNGFSGLPGRNKQSTDVDKNDHQFLKKVHYARKNNLWHYHIGIPDYDKTNQFGDWTSKYIIHYQLFNETVKVIDFDSHPPFTLPPEDYLL